MDEKNVRFSSEIKIELPLFREFLNLSIDVTGRNTLFRFLQVILVLHCIANMNTDAYRFAFFVLAVLLPLIEWWNRRKIRDGGVAYKQLLYQHEGNIPHQIFRFEEDHVVAHNPRTGNDRATPYSQYVKLWESKNLLVLILDVNMYLIIDKRTLTGGTTDELIAFLHEKCPGLKHTKGRFGRFLRRMLWVVLIVGAMLGVLVRTPRSVQIPEPTRGEFSNATSYEEMITELAKLDIIISDKVINTTTTGEVYFMPDSPDYLKVYYLLCWEGQGTYLLNGVPTDPHIPGTDLDALVWAPSTSGVYWFGLKALDANSIYTNFLLGVDSMDGTLSFTNIIEEYNHADPESGTVCVSFDYLDQHYELEAECSSDWFDYNILLALGRILKFDSDPKEIWICSGVDQGILLYYAVQEDVDILEQKTGLTFYDWLNVPVN